MFFIIPSEGMPRPESSLKIRLTYGLIGLSFLLIYILGYQVDRTAGELLIFLFSTLFFTYLWILYLNPDDSLVYQLIWGSIGLRLILLFAFPNLSDDIYRFVWDGRLLGQGIHPFAELPAFYQQPGHEVNGLTQQLFKQLNSPNYFTIYPPFAQFIFWVSTAITKTVLGAAVVIRCFIILAETGSIFLLQKLLLRYNLPKRNVLWYAFNPLVILELTGNLHFEAFMIFFMVLAIYCLLSNSVMKAALFLAAGVASKLVPLIILPIFLRRLNFRLLVKLYLFTALFILLFFVPLFNVDLLNGMSSSISLYFQKFEFNASFYYLIREVGYLHYGYNIIASAGKYMALITFLGIMTLSLWKFTRANQFQVIMWVLTLYLFMATTVHPWYITTIIAVSVFTPFRFVILWSFMIFLTYLGYTSDGFSENLWVVSLEYSSVILLMLYEVYNYARGQESWFSKSF